MRDAEKIVGEVYSTVWPGMRFASGGQFESAMVEAAQRGIEHGYRLGCTPVERELIEAWHGYTANATVKTRDRWLAAEAAFANERKPNPLWSVDLTAKNMAIGPNGSERAYWRNGGLPDYDTCAAEVARLNQEAEEE